jgi:hypothetical protein
MPIRVLQHRHGARAENADLEIGRWGDIPLTGQMLTDIEFLTRFTPPSGTSCIYAQSPAYLKDIACLFPHIHFFAYQQMPSDTYDPERPECTQPLVQVQQNTTVTQMELTTAIAKQLAASGTGSSRVLICHGKTNEQQMCLHYTINPTFALMDIEGIIPAEFPDGEIILPLAIPNNKMFANIILKQNARGTIYDPETYASELGKQIEFSTLYYI